MSLAPSFSSPQNLPEAHWTQGWRGWLLVLVAVVPFQLPLLQHCLLRPDATGFLDYDAPYYLANARAVFEHGNGFAYANPYDPSSGAPVIYFQWLLWLLGAGVIFLRADPGVLFAAVGVAAALACASLTLRLVEEVLAGRRGQAGWFLLTMWGGGGIVLATMSANLLQGQPLTADLFRFDPGEGWWFSNWGRNLISPTEAVYHALVAAAWLGVLRRRWWAFVAVGALAATHPFSGLQHLLIFLAWFALAAVREPSRRAWMHVGAVALMLGVFGSYYFYFLNLFPAHRALVARWSLAHFVSLTDVAVAIGPLALIAAWRAWRRECPWHPSDGFWLVAAAVTFLLMKHDWFIPARQPAHFSRGYLWLPLWFLALPQLQLWFAPWWAQWRRGPALLATGLLAAVGVTDNAAFLAHDLTGDQRDRAYLSADQREMFAWMDHAGLRGVLLCSDTRLSYLSATYCGVRPYLGHLNNTPDLHHRWQNLTVWKRQGTTGLWFDTVDYVLVPRTDPPANFDWTRWRELHRNHDYLLLGRPPAR